MTAKILLFNFNFLNFLKNVLDFARFLRLIQGLKRVVHVDLDNLWIEDEVDNKR